MILICCEPDKYYKAKLEQGLFFNTLKNMRKHKEPESNLPNAQKGKQ